MSEHPTQAGFLHWADKPGHRDSDITAHFGPYLARSALARTLNALDLPDKLDRSDASDRGLGALGPPLSALLLRGGRAPKSGAPDIEVSALCLV
eukprot:5132383-Pyramimonas_sp.AAC.1